MQETLVVKNTVADFVRHTVLLSLGSALCAFVVNALLVPHGFLGRGFTGAALILYYRYPVLPIGVLYLLMNVPVFALGWRFVGLRFVFYSLWGMAIYSTMLHFVTLPLEIDDKMLSAVIAGGISGTGLAVILRSYGSIGGAEILCVILHKVFSITLGAGSLLINAAVLAVAALLFPIENVFYTLVYVAITAQATNMVFHGLAKRQAALIISENWQEILHELTSTHRVGVTRINGQGGYQGGERTILYSVINRKNVSSLKKLVLEKDPHAFIALMAAEDVTGVEVGNQPHW
jgi:uncharacterized membrane-anchored protein YitT (DUF2179 family)